MDYNIKTAINYRSFYFRIAINLFITLICVIILTTSTVLFKTLFKSATINLTGYVISTVVCICLIIINIVEIIGIFDKLKQYKNSFSGFGRRSDILIRNSDDRNTYYCEIIDKKTISDCYCLLVKNDSGEYMTFSVDKKTYYMKNVGSTVSINIDRNNVFIPGIVLSKYVEDEIFYVQVANKYGIYEYSVDFIEWEKIKNVKDGKVVVNEQ